MEMYGSRHELSPHREMIVENILLIGDLSSPNACPGMSTVEGRICPLFHSPGHQMYLIEVPFGLYNADEPHPKGLTIFTVKGRWVLSSQGERRTIREGSLITLENEVRIGVESPFPEGALLLIMNPRPGIDDVSFFERLARFNKRMDAERGKGAVFKLEDLPRDHPAIMFARSVSPMTFQ